MLFRQVSQPFLVCYLRSFLGQCFVRRLEGFPFAVPLGVGKRNEGKGKEKRAGRGVEKLYKSLVRRKFHMWGRGVQFIRKAQIWEKVCIQDTSKARGLNGRVMMGKSSSLFPHPPSPTFQPASFGPWWLAFICPARSEKKAGVCVGM